MEFLNPGLLWFSIGGSVPVIIHLLHRQRFRRIRWAAMEFLLRALKKTQRRMRLENLILLALRILIMIVLAMAIAKPFFKEPPIGALAETETLYVLVIDNSYSMGFKKVQRTSLDVAKVAAKEFVQKRRISEGDRIAVTLMSEYPGVLVHPTNKKDQVEKSIADIRLSDYGTNIYRTLMGLEPLLGRPAPFRKEVYIVTDLQRIAWEPPTEREAKSLKDLLKRISNRKQTKFFLLDVGTRNADNYALVSLRVDGRSIVDVHHTTTFAADLYNFSDASLDSVPVTLYVDGNQVDSRPTFLEANTTTTVKFRYDFIEAGPHHVEARIEPDFLPVDDSRHLAVNVRRSLQALVVDGEPGTRLESETFFFSKVLDTSGGGRDFRVTGTTSQLFSAEGVEKYDFVVLANVESVDPTKVEQLEKFVRFGGGLLLALGDRVNPVSYNEFLWKDGEGLLPAEIGDYAGDPRHENPRRISGARLDHPVFLTFRDKLSAALYDLIFYEYFRTEPGTEGVDVLARFDDNLSSPLLLEKRFGEGKVLLMTTAIDNEWNESIPGLPPYYVIMCNLSKHLASRPASRLNLQVGEPIQLLLPMTHYAQDFDLHTPDGMVLTAPAKRLEHTDKWFL
ncbi:MAG: BatA domain-containing protein, partial [Planctomycetota bacterium]